MEGNWFKRNAYAIKAVVILVMVLVLLIPMGLTESLIRERSDRQAEAIREVSNKWGAAQTVTGPVLVVPFLNPNGQQREYAYFLPEKLNINGNIISENRQRGIYNIAVYNSSVQLSGTFTPVSTEGLNITADKLLQQEAFLAVGVKDLRGINLKASWNGADMAFNSGLPNTELFNTGIQAKLPASLEVLTNNTFTIDLSLRGSGSFSFSPLGKTTKITMKSNWDNPSFDGAALPDTHSVADNKGFTASWEMLNIGRNYPQQWTGNTHNINSSDISVKLRPAIDTYQQSLRSVKYAILVLGLTFLLFYFIELLQQRAVHPLQYMLIGLALCVFYTLLIAISEQLSFVMAYIIASVMTIGLITFYVASVFKKMGTTLTIAGVLTTLYGFLYVIIRSEDQSLLMGSLGLFVILAIVMYLSRRIRWEQLSSPTVVNQ